MVDRGMTQPRTPTVWPSGRSARTQRSQASAGKIASVIGLAAMSGWLSAVSASNHDVLPAQQ